MLRVVPAQQCLDAHNAITQYVYLRLIAQEKFVAFDTAPQARLYFETLRQQEIEVAGEKARGVSTGILGLVHGRVGVLQQLLHVGRVVGVVRNANRCGHRQFVA